MKENNGASMFGVALVAGITGAGLALLFAPESGRETRKRLGKRVHDVKDQAQDSVQHARDSAEQGVERIREAGEELRQQGTKRGRSRSPLRIPSKEEV